MWGTALIVWSCWVRGPEPAQVHGQLAPLLVRVISLQHTWRRRCLTGTGRPLTTHPNYSSLSQTHIFSPQHNPTPPIPATLFPQVASINRAIGASSAIAMQCKSLVKQYLPQIIAAIQDMPLDAICSTLGMCPAMQRAAVAESRRRLLTTHDSKISGRGFIRPQAAQQQAATAGTTPAWAKMVSAGAEAAGVKAGVLCDFCQAAVQYVKIALDNNSTVDQIADAVGQLCDSAFAGLDAGPAQVRLCARVRCACVFLCWSCVCFSAG